MITFQWDVQDKLMDVECDNGRKTARLSMKQIESLGQEFLSPAYEAQNWPAKKIVIPTDSFAKGLKPRNPGALARGLL